jgi:hypothetical protein
MTSPSFCHPISHCVESKKQNTADVIYLSFDYIVYYLEIIFVVNSIEQDRQEKKLMPTRKYFI